MTFWRYAIICRLFDWARSLASGYSAYAAGRLAAVEYQGANCTSSAIPTGGTVSNPLNPNTFYEMYSYTQPGERAAKKFRVARLVNSTVVTADLDSSYTYDNEGRMTGLTYPSAYDSFQNPITGNTYAYTFDSMGRPTRLNDSTTSMDVISTATYGPAGELLTLNGPGYSESRSYNTLLQLSTISGTGINQTYNYAAGNDNGKAVSMTDAVSGETVTYTYDALNRLTQALSNSSSAPWGQSFNYDIFGNLTDKNVVAGSAPTYHTSFASATNRDNAVSYDANGNQTNLPASMLLNYDIENRLVLASGVYTSAQTLYEYGPGNVRMYQANWTYNNGTGYSTLGTEMVYFYSVAGQKIGTFQFTVGPSSIWFVQESTEVWFGAKLVSKNGLPAVADRLGSFGKYYPYGEDRGSGNPSNDQEKFATYTRDSSSGLDYAMNRYFNSVSGRFMTADQYKASEGDEGDPSVWNRYVYTSSDPLNYFDPAGSDEIAPTSNYFLCEVGAGEKVEFTLCEVVSIAPIATYFSAGDSNFPECNGGPGAPKGQLYSANREANLEFVLSNWADAAQVGQAFGVPADAILAWSAQETNSQIGFQWLGWGTSLQSQSNQNNFFNQTNNPNNQWNDTSACGPNSNSYWACFASFADSALSAFTSFGYGSILANGYADGQTAAQTFQQLANAGWARGNLNYGANVQSTIKGIDSIIDCLTQHGYM